ncbi:MAG: tetratricopeptide repeat protein [Bacteroidia bacterium]|nr:tetratricopeptide repeat protein [Bacteroidia bacterium]
MKFIQKNILCLFFLFFFFEKENLTAQGQTIDSLQLVIKTLNAESSSASLDDTIRINALISLSKEYVGLRDYGKAIKYASIAKIISEKLVAAVEISVSKSWLANAYQSIAYAFENQENYANALSQYKKELTLREEVGNNYRTALCLNKIGELYNYQDNFAASMDYYYRALKLIDEVNYKDEILTIYNNLGITYDRQRNYDKSLEYYNKVLKLSTEIGDQATLGISYSNIGTVYAEQGKFDKSLVYFFKFLKIAEVSKNIRNVAIAYLNISNVYEMQGDFDRSFATQFKALKILEEIGNQGELALINSNIGVSFMSKAKRTSVGKSGNLREAKKYFNIGLQLYQKIGQIEGISQSYDYLSELEELMGNHQASLQNYKMHIQYRDSLTKLIDNEKSIRAEMNYEFEQKENITRLEQERKEDAAKQISNKQKQLLNLFIVAFIFMVILAVLIFRSNRHKQKANKIITLQKIEVERQKSLVEEKQSQILSSISYAKRIQESILISEDEITAHIPNLFITYLPKDIVSGDFYWYSKQGHESFIVVADCTGHGVPGAFLSMVGSTLLNEIIIHKKIHDPALIINSLATGLSGTLANKEKDELNTDGMDISICKIDHITRKLYFAGANQSIFIVDNYNTKEIKPQISSINGIFAIDKTEKITSVEIDLRDGIMVYMSTDGYVDQIGEETQKKYLTSRYEKLLGQIHTLSVEKQKYMLEETFDEWKGDSKQIDDVLIIGFKI